MCEMASKQSQGYFKHDMLDDYQNCRIIYDLQENKHSMMCDSK